jgi:GT2 family glycosyltransferase
MDFSVVIPSQNRAGLVARTVAAFLAQEGVDFELIVVDDGSADDTAQRLHKIKDRRLRVVRQENRGLAAARNTGVSHAQRRYVLFNDDDIVPEPGFLSAHLELHRQHANIAAVSRIQIPDSLGQDPFTCFWREQAESGIRGKADGAALGRGGFWFVSLSVERTHLPAAPFASFTAYGWEEHELGLRLWAQGIRPHLATRARATHEDRVNLEGVLAKYRSMGRMAWQFYRLHPGLQVALWTGANPISLAFKRWAYRWPRAERLLQERGWEQGEQAFAHYRFLLEAAYTQGLLEGRGAP